ncbi:MAG TPA: 5-formyltetrahydrofolate cyclo-ligase [Lachnospiraceae bacterium]|nr:5-formyltetrahydrofolate cyclo-ligase [Lachnospiraceae bacterium]HPF28866.1 5-formyltetrahydrofolate cyclo-ligase [Lachnospiraceae bacterium]
MELPELKEQKTKFRKEYIKKRNSVAPPDAYEYSRRICNFITTESRFIKAKDILLYYNYGSEVRTDFLFNEIIKQGKNAYYPRVNGVSMDFYKISSFQEFTDGFKGIKEPFRLDHVFTKDEYIRDAIIVVPGCAFSRDGHRLGYGRGYYDRYLERYPKLWKIGIGYSVQIASECPHDEKDVQMDEIICENEIIMLNGKGEARWI